MISIRQVLLICCSILLFTASLSGVVVDLQDPLYTDGMLKTEHGGVIHSEGMRIQARKILYIRRGEPGDLVHTIEAEGELVIDYGRYLLVGTRLFYDFEAKRGVLENGRTALWPWNFGGREIHLLPDKTIFLVEGYATTSEKCDPEWKVEADKVCLRNYKELFAKDVKFRFFNYPLFWLPSFRINLDTIFDSPIRYTIKWGGTQGSRIGMSYALYSSESWQLLTRIDYRVKFGFGGGLELHYTPPGGKQFLRSINYFADDSSRYNPDERRRYRYQGIYENNWDCNRTNFHLSYDKLSDKEMATDYADRGLRMESAKRTEISFRRQEESWIANFLARFRINDFQTIKQELPTLLVHTHPYQIGASSLMGQNIAKLSYLEFEYTDNRPDVHDYNSPRYELYQSFYYPMRFKNLRVTPEANFLAIYYNNNSESYNRWMTIGLFGLSAESDFHRVYGNYKHVVTPYLRYQYYTYPTTPPDDHYIFDIDDGWYRLNQLRSGFVNHWYAKDRCGNIFEKCYVDSYLYTFFDTKTIPMAIPKAYNRVVYHVTPTLFTSLDTIWNFDQKTLDRCNLRLDWTVHENLAFAAEYRHRSAYDWRKLDYTNFILDSFRDTQELKDSSLSDRRDTFLLHLFYRFHYDWAFIFQSRNGWNRRFERNYWEYEFELLGTVLSAGQLKLSYRHKEDDDRFGIHFNIGLNRPRAKRNPFNDTLLPTDF